jgi:hypothetical protein
LTSINGAHLSLPCGWLTQRETTVIRKTEIRKAAEAVDSLPSGTVVFMGIEPLGPQSNVEGRPYGTSSSPT